MLYFYLWSFVEKAEVCIFQGVTVLGPGQSLVQYFEGELCYTVQCLPYKDPQTGFYAMDITSVNCSQKCGSVCIIHPLHNIKWITLMLNSFFIVLDFKTSSVCLWI